jgi:hypothetical protein
MKKLEYLGLDETRITSKGLLAFTREFYRVNGFKSCLKYLSIQE